VDHVKFALRLARGLWECRSPIPRHRAEGVGYLLILLADGS